MHEKFMVGLYMYMNVYHVLRTCTVQLVEHTSIVHYVVSPTPQDRSFCFELCWFIFCGPEGFLYKVGYA